MPRPSMQHYPYAYPQQYNDYYNETQHLNTSQPQSHSGYYDTQRNTAVRYMNDQTQFVPSPPYHKLVH